MKIADSGNNFYFQADNLYQYTKVTNGSYSVVVKLEFSRLLGSWYLPTTVAPPARE